MIITSPHACGEGKMYIKIPPFPVNARQRLLYSLQGTNRLIIINKYTKQRVYFFVTVIFMHCTLRALFYWITVWYWLSWPQFYSQKQCDCYWPQAGTSKMYGDVSVNLDAEESYADYHLRIFSITAKVMEAGKKNVRACFFFFFFLIIIFKGIFPIRTPVAYSNLFAIQCKNKWHTTWPGDVLLRW